MSNFSQKGLSLYLAIMIMSILLAIVLGMSAILFHQLKMIGEMGNSVVAFYAADTGIERALYDENNCLLLTDTPDCAAFSCRADDNGDGYCDGVAVDYDTGVVNLDISGATYEAEFITVPSNGFRSKGNFQGAKRALEIHY
jgi:Tfp pilus assembly protein PilX